MPAKTCLGPLLPVATMVACFAACGLAAEPAKKPNILFIAIDDLNDWVGCLRGHPQAQTPHIDRLAARGTLFTNAHCQSPLCNPSRTSLMIGRRPSTTGIYGLAPWFRDVDGLKDMVSLPEYLAAHGYRTYSTGKVYHGEYGRKRTDHEFEFLGPASSVGARPPKKLVKTPAPHPLVDWGVFPHRDEDKGDYKVASWAMEQIEQGPKEPFFLSVGFFLPHVPCYATQQWFDLYPEKDLILPPVPENDRDDTPRFSWYLHWRLPEPRLKFLREANQWKNHVRSYLACVSFVDSQVGRVLDALDKKGLTDNTLVVLWSDHGYHIGEKLITGKNTLWQRSTHVPLIFAARGVAEGATCDQPAELLDIYPTLLELCGLPPNENLEGHSLVEQLKDATAKRPWPAITTHNQGNHTIRTDRWRYIRYADGSEELYDVQADPNEWRNLAGEGSTAAVVGELRKWLPKKDVPPAPGSRSRVLTYKNGKATWEGKPIAAAEPIPEL